MIFHDDANIIRHTRDMKYGEDLLNICKCSRKNTVLGFYVHPLAEKANLHFFSRTLWCLALTIFCDPIGTHPFVPLSVENNPMLIY